MIEITSEIYRDIAALLTEEIGGADYFNGTVEYETEEFYSTLTLTAIVYRSSGRRPEGETRMVTDIVPVWWEFATVQQSGGSLNDFSFTELKRYITEYE